VIGVLAFVPLLIIDREMTAMEAVKASYEALKPHGWMMCLLMIVLGLVSSLGFCACCVGILVTLPITIIGQALIYNNFFPPTNFGLSGTQIGMEPPR
jgi:uncharacterized membrane protein